MLLNIGYWKLVSSITWLEVVNKIFIKFRISSDIKTIRKDEKGFSETELLFLLSTKHLSANNVLNEKELASTNIVIFLTQS